MSLFKVTTKEDCLRVNDFVGNEFLQSSYWRDLVRLENENCDLFIWQEDEVMLASALVIKKKLLGKYFYYYLPHGPIGEPGAVKKLLTALSTEPGLVFIRLEFSDVKGLSSFNLKKTKDLQPAKTLMLNLGLEKEELFKNMHQKTRYNIRLAEKKGVEVFSVSEREEGELWRLLKLTGERDGFRLHKRPHYQNLLKSPEFIKLFIAKYKEQVIAAGLFSFFNKRVTYLHGASDNSYRQLMAPHLLQWRVIEEAKEGGYREYDFYGIDEEKWPGVTRFKLGFGGQEKEYPGTYDLINNSILYSTYMLSRSARRFLVKIRYGRGK